MKLLVVGSGGREHAIAKKLLESKDVEKVFVAPGNDGMTLDGLELVNISISEHSELAIFCTSITNFSNCITYYTRNINICACRDFPYDMD